MTKILNKTKKKIKRRLRLSEEIVHQLSEWCSLTQRWYEDLNDYENTKRYLKIVEQTAKDTQSFIDITDSWYRLLANDQYSIVRCMTPPFIFASWRLLYPWKTITDACE